MFLSHLWCRNPSLCANGVLFVSVILWAATGCGNQNQSPQAARPSGSASTVSSVDDPHGHSHHEHEQHEGHTHDHTAAPDEAADIQVQLAKLSESDRSAAEKQKICPVSGEPLGSMGVPPKIEVEGQELFLCCIGCADAVKKDPKAFLEKVTR